ncbi:MAG: hypothetical protein U1F61_04445 [Opitutaceae bacterium]
MSTLKTLAPALALTGLLRGSPTDDALILEHAESLRRRAGAVEYRIDPTIGHPEAFRIERAGREAQVVAGGPAGVLYGVQELVLPQSVVGAEGRPDFNLRGAVLMMLSASWAYQSDLSPEVYPWFFDRPFMTRYLDYLLSARLNTLVLWSGHLFPHILELPEYPDASQFSRQEIRRNQEQFRWLTTEAAKRNITVLTHFYNIHISEHLAKAMGRKGTAESDATRYLVPDDFVRGYYTTILSRYFAEFPNVGLSICPGESLDLKEQQAWFRDVIFKAARDSGKNPKLIIRDWTLDSDFKQALPTLYPNLYSELKHNDETITSPWPDERHETWKGVLAGHVVNLHDPADITPYRVGSPRLIGEMVRRWNDAGSFTGAWFYAPQTWCWPHTLDVLPEGTAPLVNFERDELWHLLEGRYLWRAHREVADEQAWSAAWLGRKWGHERVGRLMTEWYDLTGPILPGLQNLTSVRFGNFFPTAIAAVQASVDDLLSYRTRLDDPRPEGPTGLTNQRYYSRPIDAYTLELYRARHGDLSLKDSRSLPVAQLAVELAAGREGSGYVRPDHLLDLYHDMASQARDRARQALAFGGRDPEELRRFLQDSECLLLTVDYYRCKVLAALEKKRFQLTGDKTCLVRFRRHMDDSVIGYERLYTTARRFYRAGSPMFHAWSWEKTFERRVKWDHELQMKWLSGFGS